MKARSMAHHESAFSRGHRWSSSILQPLDRHIHSRQLESVARTSPAPGHDKPAARARRSSFLSSLVAMPGRCRGGKQEAGAHLVSVAAAPLSVACSPRPAAALSDRFIHLAWRTLPSSSHLRFNWRDWGTGFPQTFQH